MPRGSLWRSLLVLSLLLVGVVVLGLTRVATRSEAAATRTVTVLRLEGQVGGAMYAADAQGSYAYVGIGPRLAVLDVSDPTRPREVGKTPPLSSTVVGVAVSGTYGYVALRSVGLGVVDLSTPTAPRIAGLLTTSLGDEEDVAAFGSYALLADGTAGLRVIDVSNPRRPREVARLDTPGRACGVVLSGTLAYVADENALRIVDVSTPTNPKEVGSVVFSPPRAICEVMVRGRFAYLQDGLANGMWIADVSQVNNPIVVRFFPTQNPLGAMTLQGDRGYLAEGPPSNVLWIVDLINPLSPTLLSTLSLQDRDPQDLLTVGSHLYMATRNTGLRILDISSVHPKEVGVYETLAEPFDVVVSGTYAYVVDDPNRIYAVNVLTPATATIVGRLDLPKQPGRMAVEGGYGYVTLEQDGLAVVDLSSPPSPRAVGTYTVWFYNAYDVAISGTYAYLAYDNAGLHILDISNPVTPTAVGTYTQGYVRGVALGGRYAYLADPIRDLVVVLDVSNPRNPVEVALVPLPAPMQMVVSGTYLYVASSALGDGLRILDVTSPTRPTEVGRLSWTGGIPTGVTVGGRYAYLTFLDGVIRMVDVSDPTTPREVARFDLPGRPRSVKVGFGAWKGIEARNGYVYVANEDEGLLILKPVEVPLPYYELFLPAIQR